MKITVNVPHEILSRIWLDQIKAILIQGDFEIGTDIKFRTKGGWYQFYKICSSYSFYIPAPPGLTDPKWVKDLGYNTWEELHKNIVFEDFPCKKINIVYFTKI